MKTLGGEIELDPGLLGRSWRNEVQWSFPSYQSVSTGRTGLKLILRSLKDESRRKALLPSYLCDSVLQPFKEEGITCHFYKIGADLSVDTEDLLWQVEQVDPGFLLFIHYFGFPVGSNVEKVLVDLKQKCWVIEDCVQGSLIEFKPPVVGHIGHFALTSFRKYLSLPDGGLVVNNTSLPLPSLPPATGMFVRHRFLGKLLRFEFLHFASSNPEMETTYLRLFADAENELERFIPLEAMSQVSTNLVNVMDIEYGTQCRRDNFTFLLKAFSSDVQLQAVGTPLIDRLPESVAPLFFPIQIMKGRRDMLTEMLKQSGIFCPVHWFLPEEVRSDARFEESHTLSMRLLSLPIDQRYQQEDMAYLVAEVKRGSDQSDL